MDKPKKLVPAPEPAEEGGGINTGKSSEQMRQEIMGEVNKLKTRSGMTNAKSYLNVNDMEKRRAEGLTMLFQMLQQAGVDPNDPLSISEFLQSLEMDDPDLFIMFEDAFNKLTEDSGGGMPAEKSTGSQPQNKGMMDRFSNLGNRAFRPGSK